MEREKAEKTAKQITEARSLLVRDNPFFGRLALGLQIACAPCQTACTDGERLIFDPEFAEELGSYEMQFVILHEVLHCALEHCTRGRTLDAELFNIACDIVVNSIILGMWGLDSIKVAGEEPMHRIPDGREGREFSAEEVYRMLLEKTLEDSPPDWGGDAQNMGKGRKILDNHDIWRTIEDDFRLRDRWNSRIRVAAAACQGTDAMPQVARRLAEKLASRSEVDWRQLLHDFLQCDMYDYNFLPPDRRFSDSDFFLPAFHADEDQGSATGLWICMDTSASISDEQLEAAMLEVQDAMRQAGLTGSISFFDGDITDPIPFETEEEFAGIEPMGGGGTSFHIIFEYLREKLYPELPRAILIFTDGYAQWPKEEDALGVPVLWLIRKDGDTRAPWGQVAEL